MACTFVPFGYSVGSGFFGFLPDGRKILFPTEDEYFEYLAELPEASALKTAA